ncbi:hypothetical protein [Halomicrobium urmianum]|uniref:hypothetical protein n=1 Tax=Halomicrobium urmianum TaxID=1586233 RepID=UPI001CDA0268|nr:hypothetical protein [Halomicrobium urmianum]
MAERESHRVAHELMDEPHIAERRVSVRQVYALVEEREAAFDAFRGSIERPDGVEPDTA